MFTAAFRAICGTRQKFDLTALDRKRETPLLQILRVGTEELVPVAARPHALEEVAAEIVRMPWESAVAMARNGQLEDAKTIVAVLTWAARRG